MPVDWERNRHPYESVLDVSGRTPLVRLRRVVDGRSTAILAKLEMLNPSGSVKDRILPAMARAAEERGQLRPGMTIIEGTTGNTGIATAMTGAALGYPVVIVMPAGMSVERQKTIQAYGAALVLTPGGESDVDLVLEKVAELKADQPGRYWEVRQFSNLDNVAAHERTTGPEIWEQTGGRLDAVVSAAGTGGTLTGISRYLRSVGSTARCYVVEPEECPVLSGGEWGAHRIEGIGDGFVPDVLDLDCVDGVVTVSSDDAIAMGRRLAREEGIFCGISSGCNVVAALKVADRHPEMRTIVTLLSDNGLRYLSTELTGEGAALEVPEREHELDAASRQRLAGRRFEVIR
ncbi:MAG TPA: cysteine synthase A [Thermomicrobiaceae bacterium]|nr:cysteine synthase A [Thermomicrobiaceae bacterium]